MLALGKLKYNLKTLSPQGIQGELGNDPAERATICCRPIEPEPGNTGEGKKQMNTTQTNTEHNHKLSGSRTRVLAEIIIFVALATALSFVIVYVMPQGGSITAGSMVPLIWLSLRRGPKIGVAAGLLYGLIQFAVLPYIAPTPYAVVQVLLDYPFAFGVLGLAGLFKKQPLVGASVTISLRFVMHFISGVVYWAPAYAAELNPLVYSAVYNGSYLIPELVVSGIIIYALQKSKVLNVYL
jgi:thiamine transporter